MAKKVTKQKTYLKNKSEDLLKVSCNIAIKLAAGKVTKLCAILMKI